MAQDPPDFVKFWQRLSGKMFECNLSYWRPPNSQRTGLLYCKSVYFVQEEVKESLTFSASEEESGSEEEEHLNDCKEVDDCDQAEGNRKISLFESYAHAAQPNNKKKRKAQAHTGSPAKKNIKAQLNKGLPSKKKSKAQSHKGSPSKNNNKAQSHKGSPSKKRSKAQFNKNPPSKNSNSGHFNNAGRNTHKKFR